MAAFLRLRCSLGTVVLVVLGGLVGVFIGASVDLRDISSTAGHHIDAKRDVPAPAHIANAAEVASPCPQCAHSPCASSPPPLSIEGAVSSVACPLPAPCLPAVPALPPSSNSTAIAAAPGTCPDPAGDASVAWRRAVLWEQALSALRTLPGGGPEGIAARPAAGAPPADGSLLVVVCISVLANEAAVRARIRATWAALRAPPDMHVIFTSSVRELAPELAEAVLAEAAREGDILLVTAPEGSRGAGKSMMTFGIISALFGRAYRFFMKADVDSFLLPRPYGVLLRRVLAGFPGVPVYGGNEFAQGTHHHSTDVSFMAGGGYFITPDIAAELARVCRACWTDAAFAEPDPTTLGAPCADCIIKPGTGDEDHQFGLFLLKYIRTNPAVAALIHAQVNQYHAVGLGHPDAHPVGVCGGRQRVCLRRLVGVGHA